MTWIKVGALNGDKYGILGDQETHLVHLMDLFSSLLMVISLVLHLGLQMELKLRLMKGLSSCWGLRMVLEMDLKMALLRDQHWDYHLELLMLKQLALIKEYYSALLMVKSLVLHLGLQMESHLGWMKELSWVL